MDKVQKYNSFNASKVRLEVLMVVKVEVLIFWVVMPCNVGYHHFGGPCSLLCQSKVCGARKWTKRCRSRE
jgi:hypothetical protein